MTYHTLPKEELDKVLATTSPHSLRHNVELLHKQNLLAVSTEPTLDYIKDGNYLLRLLKFKSDLACNVDRCVSVTGRAYAYSRVAGNSEEDVLVDLAAFLASITIQCRSEAMKHGIPLEDVQDAVIGSDLAGVSPEPVIKTILFGVS